ncbi:ATP-binding protein [Thalassobacillus hwangdonensis]|uniref:histidine kinase n=1 Tax=Thalassobacillus hwangdonensis TaxID=546108 RepID=A0ABW3KZD7_9BACI
MDSYEMENTELNGDEHAVSFSGPLSGLPEESLSWFDRYGKDLIVVLDEEGVITHVSTSVLQLLDYHREEMVGTTITDHLHDKDYDRVVGLLEGAPQNDHSANIIVKDKHGHYKLLKTHFSKNSDSSKENILSISRFIMDQNEMELQIVRCEKMAIAGQLAASVAHEIRNPLTSIKGFLQLLQSGMNKSEEYYKIMEEELQKMENVTSELLYLSKPMAGDKANESLYEMVREVILLLNTYAAEKGIMIVPDVDRELQLNCNRSQFKQILINLVKNSIEAMEQPGDIRIHAKTDGDQIYLEVVDQGPGIPDHLIHKVSEPFYTTKKNGTGLGLMICKQLLEKHDGNLEISQNHGKGSTFRIVLPARANV